MHLIRTADQQDFWTSDEEWALITRLVAPWGFVVAGRLDADLAASFADALEESLLDVSRFAAATPQECEEICARVARDAGPAALLDALKYWSGDRRADLAELVRFMRAASPLEAIAE